jgi:hypothetical protein
MKPIEDKQWSPATIIPPNRTQRLEVGNDLEYVRTGSAIWAPIRAWLESPQHGLVQVFGREQDGSSFCIDPPSISWLWMPILSEVLYAHSAISASSFDSSSAGSERLIG